MVKLFVDSRSKRIVLISHCILNQNSISDGTADYPATIKEIIKLLVESKVGIVQMPCPELICLGLDRGNILGAQKPAVMENTRIRSALSKPRSTKKINSMVDQLIFQINEYQKNGFKILGIIGTDRSPSCGVFTTSIDNQEVAGKGVFIEKLGKELRKNASSIPMIGIKGSETEKAIVAIKKLLKKKCTERK